MDLNENCSHPSQHLKRDLYASHCCDYPDDYGETRGKATRVHVNARRKHDEHELPAKFHTFLCCCEAGLGYGGTTNGTPQHDYCHYAPHSTRQKPTQGP